MTQPEKIIALDLGDRWIGVAMSDPLGFFAKPFTTVQAYELDDFLAKTIEQHQIRTIVVGYPKTLRNTESEQTKKVIARANQLKEKFPTIEWVWWDERLTSKHAASLKKEKTKEDKVHSHAVAAAVILQNYLEHLRYKKELEKRDDQSDD